MDPSKQTNSRRRFLKRLPLMAAPLLIGRAARADQTPLRVGLVPVFTPRALIALYKPLQRYLERALGQPVRLESATDFAAFYHHLTAAAFDLAVMPSHIARLLQREAGWLPLVTYTAPNRGLLIMRRDQPLRSIEALRGHRLAIFDPLALNVFVALDWIEAQGLRPGLDFQVVETPGHGSVVHAVVSGDCLLGVVSPAGMHTLTPELREQIAIFAKMRHIPPLVWALAPHLAPQAARYRAVLLSFPASAEGREFLRQSPYQGLRALGADELREVDPYLPELARRLRGPA